MAWRQWTRDDDKRFEEALVRYPETCQYRFESIAAYLGMPLQDVMYYYDALLHDVGLIESGEYATTNYPDSSGGISSQTKHNDKDRKRGKPWTEDEHRCFLELLARFGKGDWKNIARYMKSRTPTQVASHAQKYFLRQIMENRTKKRSSIHDITPVDHAAER